MVVSSDAAFKDCVSASLVVVVSAEVYSASVVVSAGAASVSAEPGTSVFFAPQLVSITNVPASISIFLYIELLSLSLFL